MLVTPPLFHPNFRGCSRCTRWPMLGSAWAGTLSYSAVKLFSNYFNLCEKHISTSRTDRQTNGRTDDLLSHRITALCVASRGNKTSKRLTTAMPKENKIQRSWISQHPNGVRLCFSRFQSLIVYTSSAILFWYCWWWLRCITTVFSSVQLQNLCFTQSYNKNYDVLARAAHGTAVHCTSVKNSERQQGDLVM